MSVDLVCNWAVFYLTMLLILLVRHRANEKIFCERLSQLLRDMAETSRETAAVQAEVIRVLDEIEHGHETFKREKVDRAKLN